MTTDYIRYKSTNMVQSVVFYEWAADFDIFGIHDLFEEMIITIGRSPDVVTVCDSKGCKDYVYRSLAKLNVLKQRDWESLGYNWNRYADDRSRLAIEFTCNLYKYKRFAVYIDDAAVDYAKKTISIITDLLTERLRPIYGIGYTVPYKNGPRWIAIGNVCHGSFENDRPYNSTTAQIGGRSHIFQPVYINRGTTSILRNHIRDIFEVNFLSQGHLDYPINGVTFRELVEKRKAGKLTRLNDITWRWDISGNEMESIRDDLIGAGMTVVTS